MRNGATIFDLFGGIRPMARKLGELPSSVSAWKQRGRIPAEKQPHVLQVGQNMGLPITAEHVVFPLGRPNAAAPFDIGAVHTPVVCDRQAGLQRKELGR